MAYRRTAHVQARLDAQRAGIVSAATALVAEAGYPAASIARVAARAAIAPGTVYNHFAGGKADLLAEVFRVVVGREVDAVRAASSVRAPAAARVTAVIETFSGRALKNPRLAYALLVEPVDPRVDELRLRFRRAFTDVVAAAICDGVESGELPPQNAQVVAAALVGAIGEALVRPLARVGGADTSADTPAEPDPDAVPSVITFAIRAIGASDAVDT